MQPGAAVILNKKMPMTHSTHKTFCRYCHAYCPMEVDVEANTVKAVHPDMTPDCASRVRVTTRRDPSWRWRSWARLLGVPGPPPFRLEARLLGSRCAS